MLMRIQEAISGFRSARYWELQLLQAGDPLQTWYCGQNLSPPPPTHSLSGPGLSHPVGLQVGAEGCL